VAVRRVDRLATEATALLDHLLPQMVAVMEGLVRILMATREALVAVLSRRLLRLQALAAHPVKVILAEADQLHL
jgi:hypothetical protein